jgi:hypothetical protein
MLPSSPVILGHRRRNRWMPRDTTSEVIRRLLGVDMHILRVSFVRDPAVSPPYHKFPAQGGSRRSRGDKKVPAVEFRRPRAEPAGHMRTRNQDGSGP